MTGWELPILTSDMGGFTVKEEGRIKRKGGVLEMLEEEVSKLG